MLVGWIEKLLTGRSQIFFSKIIISYDSPKIAYFETQNFRANSDTGQCVFGNGIEKSLSQAFFFIFETLMYIK